ncbi:hypothetical protein ACLOJK_030293 [Asimina triloba]
MSDFIGLDLFCRVLLLCCGHEFSRNISLVEEAVGSPQASEGRGGIASHLADGAAAQCCVGAEQDHRGDCGL